MSPAPAPALPVAATLARRAGVRTNFYLDGNRELGASWKDRARANVASILVADGIAKQDRSATAKEQAQLIRFTGFGAGELANGMFRRPGDVDFRQGWDDLGASLETAVSEADYASLARCTQYAHFTPEFIIRAIWAGIQKLGWRGGRVLEPGIGTGLFPALTPEPYRDAVYFTGSSPMPSDPDGIPGTANPSISGFSRSIRCSASSGTCPSSIFRR